MFPETIALTTTFNVIAGSHQGNRLDRQIDTSEKEGIDMTMYQSNESLLRNALTANGLFSALIGVICILAPNAISGFLFQRQFGLFGMTPDGLIFGLGIGLVLFAAFVLWMARQTFLHIGRAKIVTTMDVGWVLGTIALLFTSSGFFSSAGQVIVFVVAAMVLIFSIEQAIGIAIIYQGSHHVFATTRGDTLTLTATGATSATPERVWQIMSDQERYADVADNLSKVEIVAGNGIGMIRKCFDTNGKSWSETCTLWEEGQAFAFRVHTEAEDYPYPIAKLGGKWALSEQPDGTEVNLTFHVTAKPGLVNRLLFKAMAAPFSTICDRLLNNWIAIMEGTGATSSNVSTRDRDIQALERQW